MSASSLCMVSKANLTINVGKFKWWEFMVKVDELFIFHNKWCEDCWIESNCNGFIYPFT